MNKVKTIFANPLCFQQPPTKISRNIINANCRLNIQEITAILYHFENMKCQKNQTRSYTPPWRKNSQDPLNIYVTNVYDNEKAEKNKML